MTVNPNHSLNNLCNLRNPLNPCLPANAKARTRAGRIQTRVEFDDVSACLTVGIYKNAEPSKTKMRSSIEICFQNVSLIY